MTGHEIIGVFGGTFDPIHNVHLNAARTALDQAHLDRVLFIVSARPPHKRDDTVATAEDRLALVRAAIAGEPRFEASDIESGREGPSYTHDTLAQIAKENPGAELFLIMGDDSFAEFPTWRDPRAILAYAKLLVVPRPGKEPKAPEWMRGQYQILAFNETDVSSTDIRRRVANGDSISQFVPAPVERLIQDRQLYAEEPVSFDTPRADEFLALLRERLPDKTFRHSVSVARTMLEVADEAGITAEQAVTAGLLHDLCKPLKGDDIVERAKAYGITDYLDTPTLLHGPVAAEECRRKLGITDEEVIDAIRWHTTGRAKWGRVGQALFYSDFSEPRRPHRQAAEARAIFHEKGFDAALRYVVEQKFHYVKTRFAPDPHAQAFEEWVRSTIPA
jgi:nicotinate-nucleotide adenylyltransferase